jgi:hypothetical protein
MPVSFSLRIFLWLWFGAAIAAGHFLVLQRLPPIAVQIITLGLTGFLAVLYYRLAALRTWLDSLDLRVLVLVNAVRFIGLYLLFQYQRGELPRAFAVPASVTDVIVATMALPIALAPIGDAARHRLIVIWNVVGFAGLLIANVTAARLNLQHPLPLRALTHLPLSLFPTFVFPLLLAIHVVIFERTRRPSG